MIAKLTTSPSLLLLSKIFGDIRLMNKNKLNANKQILFEYKTTFAATKRYSKRDKPETLTKPYKIS